MPTVAALLIIAIMQSSVSARIPQACAAPGTAAWSETLRTVLPDCEMTSASPDGRFVTRIDSKGAVHVSTRDGRALTTDGLKVMPPAMVSWSPRSDVFFINDGEGSGMSSVLRLFRVTSGVVTEDQTINRAALARFRREKRCKPSNTDLSVWEFGWSRDGSHLYLFVQDGPHQFCERPEVGFISWVVRVADAAFVERVSQRMAERRFGRMLPSELFSRWN
jgi:hypothetical protein